MKLIINNSSMIPIYEQIVDQIKNMIMHGELKNEDLLPSVRHLASELRISALTVKKAYDTLEACGYALTVHGKGTYIKSDNKEIILEEYKKEIENDFKEVIAKAKRANLSDEEIYDIFKLMMGD